MTPVRRIASAAIVAVLGFGVVGMGGAPATAVDTTWGQEQGPPLIRRAMMGTQ